MVDIDRLDAYLSSDDAPEEAMMVSDIDGFLTGVLCSPELISPSEWLPVIWGEDGSPDTEEGLWAIEEILNWYNEIALGLNDEPPILNPIFWEHPDGTVIAMDWCEGFMDAFAMRDEQWAEFMESEDGQDWMMPVLAHLLDENGNSLIGIKKNDLPALLDEASELIAQTIPNVFVFWTSKRAIQN